MIVKRIVNVFKAGGVGAVLAAGLRRLRMPHARSFALANTLCRERIGLEIGGPSPIFSPGGLLPVYRGAERIDNCNFSARTIWEGDIVAGETMTFRAGRMPGRQFVLEGGTLSAIENDSYDFVLSSHMLEHTANPLATLREWFRVIRVGGTLVLVLPHRDGTFDHRRPVTTIAHLRQDAERQTGEDDQTHVDEIMALHDVARDPGVASAEAFRERALNNYAIRSLHHHVFDTRLAVAAVSEVGFRVVRAEALLPYHIVVVAAKTADDAESSSPDAPLGDALRTSPFATDHA